MVTFAKFLGYVIKYENYDPDSPKIGKSCEISLAIDLNTFFKYLNMFIVDNNDPLYSA